MYKLLQHEQMYIDYDKNKTLHEMFALRDATPIKIHKNISF